jgi:hypothetical protein
VYHTPRTKAEIAEELGVTPVFVEDKIELLEQNGFLVRQTGDKFTTYVKFSPESYSIERLEYVTKKELELASQLADEYAPAVRTAIADMRDIYIPGGNRELLEALAVYYGVSSKCGVDIKIDTSRYVIKTTDGGKYIASVDIPAIPSDPDYVRTIEMPSYWTCGSMTRLSRKYPSVYSWSVDSKLSSREGGWQNNLTEDYEYLYEFITGAIEDNPSNAEKFKRLRGRRFITDDGKANIMVAKGSFDEFSDKIPAPGESLLKKIAEYGLEAAEIEARDYPPQMRDLIMAWNAGGFVGNTVAMMVMDILYGNGTFHPLGENEKVTSNLIMFCDTLPA